MQGRTNRQFKLFEDYKIKIKKQLKDNLKVIYTDLDGTLLNDRGCLFKDDRERFFFDGVRIFKKIEEKGQDIVLISGRDKFQLRFNAMLMGLRNYVSELGCEITYDLGRDSYVVFNDKNYKYKIVKGGKDLLSIIQLMKKAFPGKIDSNIEWSMARSYNALFSGEIDIGRANLILEENGYGGLVFVDNGFSRLFNPGPDVKNPRIYNLLPKGVDKSSAINLDKKIREFETKNCIALGDSAEDVKMAKEVSAFFLMKDAIVKDPGIIKLISNYENIYVTSLNMNRGWVEVMKYLAD